LPKVREASASGAGIKREEAQPTRRKNSRLEDCKRLPISWPMRLVKGSLSKQEPMVASLTRQQKLAIPSLIIANVLSK
jgi:hypothetical protein